jgi:hypothetical protein
MRHQKGVVEAENTKASQSSKYSAKKKDRSAFVVVSRCIIES